MPSKLSASTKRFERLMQHPSNFYVDIMKPRQIIYNRREVAAIKAVILPMGDVYPWAKSVRVRYLTGGNRQHLRRVQRNLEIARDKGFIRLHRVDKKLQPAAVPAASLVIEPAALNDLVVLTDEGVDAANRPEYYLEGRSDVRWVPYKQRQQIFGRYRTTERAIDRQYISCLA